MIHVLTTMSLGRNYLDPHFLFLFSREPSNRTPCERPQKCLSKKEIFEYFSIHLSFWVSGVESPLIFLYKKHKKELNTKYMTELFHSH